MTVGMFWGSNLRAVGHIATARGYLCRTVDLKEVNCTIGNIFHIMYAQCLCVHASSHTYGYLHLLSTGIIGAP